MQMFSRDSTRPENNKKSLNKNGNTFCCELLRLCPWEDQAGVTQAIAPIWMKLGQIEGPTQ